MEYEVKGVTITWQVENIKSRRENEELYSPVITVDVMDGTKWRLGVDEIDEISSIRLIIKREAEDNGPEEYELLYEFSINDGGETFWDKKKTRKYVFRKNEDYDDVSIYLNEDHYLTTDTITIQCNIYKQQKPISKWTHFFIRTRVKVKRWIFRGEIENFSNFSTSDKKTVKIVSSPANQKLIKVDFFLQSHRYVYSPRGTALKIEIIPMIMGGEQLCNFRVSILNSCYKKTEIGKLDEVFYNDGRTTFTLPEVSKEYLMENAAIYLPNDTLSLYCELSYCSGIEYEKVERIEFETDSVAEEKQTDLSRSMHYLLGKGEESDTKLQTTTETFPAHTAVLRAHSPVFDAMFKSNMKESIQKCVHIDDVDAETMNRMLVFLYSETVEELEWKDAMKLYVASDKYEILTLKGKCTALLKQSINFSNFCVLLHLADMHQDGDLMRTAENYINENYIEVLHAVQWSNLEKNLPQLAIKILRAILVRRRFY